MTIRMPCTLWRRLMGCLLLGYTVPTCAGAAELQVELSLSEKTRAAIVHCFDTAEFDVHVRGGAQPWSNPYDPNDVTVDAVFQGPDGQTLKLPAFWYVPYRRYEKADGSIDVQPVPDAEASWRVRFAPTSSGRWSGTVHVRDRSGKASSRTLEFEVAAPRPGRHGFVQRARGAGGNRYFAYHDGTPYFLIGMNTGWARDNQGLRDFDAWFSALSRSEANFARVWTAWRPLETAETGTGRYDQANAAYHDETLRTAERNRLSLMLALGTYGDLTTGGPFNEGQWAKNPYNARNGGPVPENEPLSFFTQSDARRLYRNRLRYLTARYGAYTSLGFWEFWNEGTGPPAWYAEMSRELRRLDPYQRPITTSFTTTGPADVWKLPDMDLTQMHRYGDEGSLRDIAPGLPGNARVHDTFQKPHLVGEFGISWRRSDRFFDEKGIGTNLHNGLWSGALSGNAGGAMVWWWDDYVHPNNLYPEFTSLARFAHLVDWPRRKFIPLDLPAPEWTNAPGDRFMDLKLTPESGWGARSAGPLTIGADGSLQGTGALLGYLYGPAKPDLRSPQVFDVSLEQARTLHMRVGTVSTRSTIKVAVNGDEVMTFAFDPHPGGPGGYVETRQYPEFGGIYQARFDTVREIPLPSGKSRVQIECAEGDWVQIRDYTIPRVVPARFSGLRTTALQDTKACETLLWIQDPESNWANDQSGQEMREWEDISMTVPVPKPGQYQLQWWDTRRGQILKTEALITRADAPRHLHIRVPAFRRDVALRIAPAGVVKVQ